MHTLSSLKQFQNLFYFLCHSLRRAFRSVYRCNTPKWLPSKSHPRVILHIRRKSVTPCIMRVLLSCRKRHSRRKNSGVVLLESEGKLRWPSSKVIGRYSRGSVRSPAQQPGRRTRFAWIKFKLKIALRPQKSSGLLGTGSPGRPPVVCLSQLPVLTFSWNT